MALLFPDHKTLILGESLDAWIQNCLFSAGMVIVLLEGLRHALGMPRKPNTRTLKMRKVKNATGEFLSAGMSNTNPFLREEAIRFFVFGDKIDYSVMKLLQNDVPLLAAQEHQHAKFHHLGCKELEESDFISVRWVSKVFDFLFLRTPKWMMAGFCFVIESMSPLQAYVAAVLPWNQAGISNLGVFHSFEEVEHATVTCHYLRELCPFYVRLICAFLFGIFMQLAMVIPLTMPFFAAYTNPRIILKPRTYLIDLPLFYFHLCVTEYIAIPWVVVHFLFAIPHYDFVIDHFHAFFAKMMVERGFEWEVTEERTYVLDKSLHSKAPKHNKYLDPWHYVALIQPMVKTAYDFAERNIVEATKAMDTSFQELLFANNVNAKEGQKTRASLAENRSYAAVSKSL